MKHTERRNNQLTTATVPVNANAARHKFMFPQPSLEVMRLVQSGPTTVPPASAQLKSANAWA